LIAKAKDFEKLINSCIKHTKFCVTAAGGGGASERRDREREREREREMFGLVHLVLIVKLQHFPRHNLCVMGRLVQILVLTPQGGLCTAPGRSVMCRVHPA